MRHDCRNVRRERPTLSDGVSCSNAKPLDKSRGFFGAGKGIRTLDFDLGKVASARTFADLRRVARGFAATWVHGGQRERPTPRPTLGGCVMLACDVMGRVDAAHGELRELIVTLLAERDEARLLAVTYRDGWMAEYYGRCRDYGGPEYKGAQPARDAERGGGVKHFRGEVESLGMVQ